MYKEIFSHEGIGHISQNTKVEFFVQNIHYKFFPNGYEIGFPGCTDAICTSFIDGTCIEFMINKTGYMYFTVSLNQPLDH